MEHCWVGTEASGLIPRLGTIAFATARGSQPHCLAAELHSLVRVSRRESLLQHCGDAA